MIDLIEDIDPQDIGIGTRGKMKDRAIVCIVAICGVTLIGTTVVLQGIDGVIIGTCIGMFLLLIRETYGERKREKGQDGEAEA